MTIDTSRRQAAPGDRHGEALGLPRGGIAVMPDIHATAVISANVKFGVYVKVWSNAVIGFAASLGDNVVIGSNCYVGNHAQIGQGSRLQHGVFLPNDSSFRRAGFHRSQRHVYRRPAPEVRQHQL
jgi:NDP-sugar pyrophosphorylase family protein